MGRMLEVLKQANRCPGEGVADGPTGEASAEGPGGGLGGEVPFVEVGPARSMEASPSVLACIPLRAAGPARGPAIREEAPDPAPLPATVSFRNLPARANPSERPSLLDPELVAYHSPGHALSGQYRDLLAALLAPLPDARHHVLLFTPALAVLTATPVLLNVAVTAARQGRRPVAVVDANLRQPEVAQKLALAEAPGLREVLSGAATLEQALQETEQANLLALTAGLPAPSAGVRFVAETMRSLLRQLRQRFGLVLVNGPRLDGRPDVTVLAAACDAVYPVLPEQEAESREADELLQALAAQGNHLGGCILSGR